MTSPKQPAAKSLRAPAKSRARDIRIARISDVFADLRDRIHAASLDMPVPDTEPCDIGAMARRCQTLAGQALPLGEEPHYLDPTIAADARELLLEVAAWASCAVLELDRKAIKARRTA